MAKIDDILKERKIGNTTIDKIIYQRNQQNIYNKLISTDTSDISSTLTSGGYIGADILDGYTKRLNDYEALLSTYDFDDEKKRDEAYNNLNSLKSAVKSSKDYFSRWDSADAYKKDKQVADWTRTYDNLTFEEIQNKIAELQRNSNGDEESKKEIDWLRNYAIEKEYSSSGDYDKIYSYASAKIDELLPDRDKLTLDMATYNPELYAKQEAYLEQLNKDIEYYTKAIDFAKSGKNLKKREETYKTDMLVLGSNRFAIEELDPNAEKIVTNREFGNPTRDDLIAYDNRRDSTTWYTDANGNYYNVYGEPIGDIDEYNSKYADNGVEDRLGLYLQAHEQGVDTEAVGNNDTWSSIVAEGVANRWDLLTDDEKKVYYYYLNTSGKERADRFLDSMSYQLGKRENEGLKESIEDASALELILYNVASVPANVFGGIAGFVDDAINTIEGKDINPYSSAHRAVNYASAVRGETSEDIQEGIYGLVGDIVANTYQAVMSGADSLLGAATLGSGYTVAMGMGAATQKASELYERGASRSQIALGALASGAIEYITEKFSYDFIVNKLKNNAESRWGLIKAILASAGNEGIEEVNSDILNMISESIIQGYNSADEVKVRELIDTGLTEDAARKRVAAENAVNIFWSFYGGAISGGLMSTGVAALGLAENTAETREKNRQTGSALSETNNVDALMADVETLDDSKENARAKALAKKIAETDTEKLSKRQTDAYNRKVGELYTEATKNRIQQVYGSDKTAIRSAIRAELENRGVKKIDKATEVILKSYFDKLSPSESILYDKINGKEVLTAALNKNNGEVFRSSDRIASENMRSVSKLASLTTKAKGDVSTSGITEQISTGKEVKIAKIEAIKDGKMTFRLQDGSVVDSSDIRYANNDQALIYEGVLSMGVNADSANAIVSAYSAAPSIGAIPYIMGAQEAYNYGAVGYKQRYINSNGFYADLTDGQKELIYGLGASDAEADVSVKQKAIDEAKKSNTVKKGKITLPVEYSSLTDIQKASVSAVGRIVTEITHNEVEFYESVEKNGERVFASDVDGYKAGEVAPNGWYDAESGKIYLDLNSGNHGEGTIMWTAAHELTHFIRQWSPVKFKILADFLMAEYGKKGVDIETLILRQQEKARKRGREIDHDTAYEEVVADSMSEMFTDSRANISKKLFTLKQTDAGLVRKIKEFLNKMFESIQKLYNKLDAQTPEARYVRSMGDSIGKLSDLFADALKDAGETYLQIDNAKANNSLSNEIRSDRVKGHEEYDKPINIKDIELLREIIQAHNGARVSINDFTSEDIQKAQKWAYKFYKELGTKSPFFRAWFGDWRAYDYKSKNICTKIENKKINSKSRNVINSDTKWNINISNDIVGESISNADKQKPYVLRLLGQIDEVMERAILLDTAVTNQGSKNKKSTSQFMHYFYSIVEFNGNPFLAKIDVEEYGTQNTSRRAYNLTRIKMSSLSRKTFDELKVANSASNDDAVIVSDLFQLVNTYDKSFNPKLVNPALLNDDGTPKVLYHQTDGEFTVFDVGRDGAGTRDNETPFGIFLKSSDKDIGLRGKKQIPLYARMENPLLVTNREQLISKLKEMSPTYSMLWDKSKAIDRSYSDKSKQAQKEFNDYIIRNSQSENRMTRNEMYNDPEFNRLFDAEEKVSDEWTEKAKENDILMKKEIEKTLRDNGYDGVILSQDAGSFGRVTDAFIVLDNTQVKSATDNIGTFDGKNPDFLYSLREVEPIKPTTDKWSRSLTTDESQPLSKKNSLRDIDATDNRSILANALKTVAIDDTERAKLEEYQAKIDTINSEQKKLTDLRAEIKRLSFATGKRDTKKIIALRDEAIKTANRIGIYDKQLLRLEAAKPLQDLLEREKEKAYKRAMNKYKEARKKDIERRTKTVLRHHIAKIADDFRKRLEKPTETRYVPRGLMAGVVRVCEEIDPTGKRQDTLAYRFNKGKDTLRELKSQYDALNSKEIDYDFKSEFSEEFSSHIEELAKAVGNTPLRDMDIDQLTDVYDIINDIAFMLDTATKQIGTDERISNYQAGQEIISLMKDVKRLGYTENDIRNFFRNWMTNPMRAIREMSAYNYDSRLVKLFDALNEGRRKADFFRMEANKEFDKLRSTKEGIKNFDDAVEKAFDFGLTDIEGKPLKITKMQAMQLVMSYNRQMANEDQVHLNTGALIPDFELLKAGKYNDAFDNAQEIGLVDMRMVSQIMSKLSEWDKQYMAVAEKFFDVTAKNAINETTMITKHRMIATDKRYIPYEVNKDEVAHENENIKFDATIEGWGSLKSTKKNASQRLVIRGLNSIISDHIDKTAKVYGLAIPVRNFNKVINMKQTAGDGGKTVRTAIRNTWHGGGLELIEQAVADLQGNRPGKNNKLFSATKSAFVVSTLAGNFSVFIKQAASYPTAGSILSSKSLIKGLSDYATKIKDGIHAQDVWDEIDSHTSQHWIRRIGLSMQELGELNQSKGWQNKLNRKLGKASPMNWIQAMDVGTTAALWYACKAEVESKGITEDMDNYWDEVTKLYDKVIEETQPMYDSLHRAEITKDSKGKDIIMFATQPLQNSGILREGSMEYKLSKKQYGKDSAEAKAASKKFRMAVTSQAASHLTFVLMSLIADMIKHKMKPWKDDDEELTPESIVLEFAKEFGKSYFGAIVPIVGNYAIATCERFFGDSKYDVLSDPTIDKINSTIDTFAKLKNQTVDNYVNAFCEVASYFGIPARNVKNIILGTVQNITDIVNGEAFSFNAGETTSQANSFVKICKTGNTSEIIDFYNKWVKDKMAEIEKQREKEGKVELSNSDLRSKAVSSIKSSVSSKFRTLYIDAYKNAKDKGIRDSEEMKNLRKQMLYSRLWDGSDEILETCKRWTDDYK